MFKYTVALPTPFDDNLDVDYESLHTFLSWQYQNGVRCFLVGGSTGEGNTLSLDEYGLLIQSVLSLGNDVRVMCGVSDFSTEKCCIKAKYCEDHGCHEILLSNPCYSKPSHDGIISHFTHVHNAVSIPMIIYNVPGRTGYDIHPITHILVRNLPRICGIKEASGHFERIYYYEDLVKDLSQTFTYYVGDDIFAYSLMLHQHLFLSLGCISVSLNVIPHQLLTMVSDINKGLYLQASRNHMAYYPIHNSLFIGGNPSSLKCALNYMRMIPENMRLPLINVSSDHRDHICKNIQFVHNENSSAK